MADNQTTRADARNFMILDTENHPLAHGRLETPPDAPTLRLLVLNADIDEVEDKENLILVSMSSNDAPMRCKVLRQRGDVLFLEKTGTVDNEVRRNLRVPVTFDSFLYPLDNSRWRGRRPIRSLDLSCGGIAFTGEEGLDLHEVQEIVIVPTEEPVVLQCEILRKKEMEDGSILYATKFENMCEDEEVVVREAVFSLQLAGRSARSDKK